MMLFAAPCSVASVLWWAEAWLESTSHAASALPTSVFRHEVDDFHSRACSEVSRHLKYQGAVKNFF